MKSLRQLNDVQISMDGPITLKKETVCLADGINTLHIYKGTLSREGDCSFLSPWLRC